MNIILSTEGGSQKSLKIISIYRYSFTALQTGSFKAINQESNGTCLLHFPFLSVLEHPDLIANVFKVIVLFIFVCFIDYFRKESKSGPCYSTLVRSSFLHTYFFEKLFKWKNLDT
jgi:hypothetical protein